MRQPIGNRAKGPGDTARAGRFRPDRSSGLARLCHFAPSAGRHYAAHRNYDLGPDERDNVSLLSPYLRHRLISEVEVLQAVLGLHSAAEAEKFVQEVFWRAYFKGWLEQRPGVWESYRIDLEDYVTRLHDDSELSKRYANAIDGNTGIDCFDAWAKELIGTGYLHNHARMWFASIWIYTLQLPWQLGADFFYRHLLDGDPASNTLSWRWVCGLHTHNKTHLARAANIAQFTNGRFNPVGQLAAEAPAFEETTKHDLVSLPIRGHEAINGQYGLLITEEDCLSESVGLSGPPAAILGLTATQERSPLATGGLAMDFARGAVLDALARAEGHYNVDGRFVSSQNWSETLVEWAAGHDLTTIVTARPPIGPVASILNSAAPALSDAGIELRQIGRAYDTMTWPHATQGFFKLKKQIPDLLRQLARLNNSGLDAGQAPRTMPDADSTPTDARQ